MSEKKFNRFKAQLTGLPYSASATELTLDHVNGLSDPATVGNYTLTVWDRGVGDPGDAENESPVKVADITVTGLDVGTKTLTVDPIPIDFGASTVWLVTSSIRSQDMEAKADKIGGQIHVGKEQFAGKLRTGMIAAYNGTPPATNQAIGLAYTLDGHKWFRDLANNPVITKEGAGWRANHVAHPSLNIVDGVMYIHFSANSGSIYSIGLAISYDQGQTWEVQGPVLEAGAGAEWDDAGVWYPKAVYDREETDPSKRWKMWFLGYDSSIIQGGYAYSADGISWTKFASNPVLEVGSGGAFDSDQAFAGCLIRENGVWHMFYNGYDGTNYRIGLATFTDPEGTYTKSGDNPILDVRDGATQSLTADLSTGNNAVTVGDTSVFEEREYVLIHDDNSDIFLARIKSIDSATGLTLDRNVDADYTTAQNAIIQSVYYNKLTASSIYREGNKWVMIYAAFEPISGERGEFDAFATADSLDGTFSIDFDRGLVLEPDPDNSAWDTSSMENFSAVPMELNPVLRMIQDKAERIGDPDQAFDVDTATTNDHAVPKGQMDTALALKAALAGATFTGLVNFTNNMPQISGEAIFAKGTWTPAFAPSSGAFGTLTYSTRAGNWYIIGPNLIKLDFFIVTSNVVVDTAAGNLLVTGMPESLIATVATKVGAITWNLGWASNTPKSISVNTSGLFRLNSDGLTVVQVSDMTTGAANNNYIQGSVICEFS